MSQRPPAPDLPLALTMGEPGGIAPEITVAAWRALSQSGPAFFVIAPPALFDGVPVAEISSPDEAAAVFARSLPVLPLEMTAAAVTGTARAETAPAVIESIKSAVSFVIDGHAGAVVTNPIQKAALTSAGFSFPGHTEFLEDLTKDVAMPNRRERGAVMMLASQLLKTVPVTVHQSIRDAATSLRGDAIIRKAIITYEALRDDFSIASPRLAISALNPHGGEQGAMGVEDEMIIAPAIDQLREMGIDARGPLPADTMFHDEARRTYDAALCMLHDQALIPVKTLAFHDAVNVTLGIPIIRTSPDHGTALDIAGKGSARTDSLIAALNLAARLSSRRRTP